MEEIFIGIAFLIISVTYFIGANKAHTFLVKKQDDEFKRLSKEKDDEYKRWSKEKNDDFVEPDRTKWYEFVKEVRKSNNRQYYFIIALFLAILIALSTR